MSETTPLLAHTSERPGSNRMLLAKIAAGTLLVVSAIVLVALSGKPDTPLVHANQSSSGPIFPSTTVPNVTLVSTAAIVLPNQTSDPNPPIAEWVSETMEPPFTSMTNLILPKLHADFNRSIPTNAWWTNFMIADSHGQHLGEGQVTVTPYTVISLNSGLQVSYGDDRRVGDNAIIQEYFADDLVFSSNPPPNTRQVVWFDQLNVKLEFKRNNHHGTFNALLSRGSPYISVKYKGMVPKLSLGGNVGAITSVNDIQIKTGTISLTASEFHFHTRIERNIVQEWIVFFPNNVTLAIDPHTATVTGVDTFYGIVRAALLPQGQQKDTFKALLLRLANTVPVATDIEMATVNNTGVMKFSWRNKLMNPNNTGDNDLLMLAFPHHVDAFGEAPLANLSTILDSRPDIESNGSFKILGKMGHRTLKGNLTAVVGSTWTIVEPLTTVRFSAPRPIDPSKRKDIANSLVRDASYVPGAKDPYFFGKEIARQARLALIANKLGNFAVRDSLVAKLQGWLLPWLTGKNGDFFVYDTVWGGVCSSIGIQGMFYMTDFGNGWYNDHHFHYGYIFYTAAVVGKFRPEFIQKHKAALFTIVRDVANYNPNDHYFPLARHFSWFDGHSFASGVYVLDGGKSQESVSEAINSYYGVYLLGRVLEMPKLEQFGRMLLAMEMRAAQTYWQTKPDIYGELYAKNEMTGMVGQTKVTYATWFGPVIEHMHLINVIPFTPITEEFLSKEYIEKEYKVLYDGAVSRTVNPMEEIWRGYAFLDHAIIDPKAAWTEVQTQLKHFDDGNSRTNSLWWIATRPQD
ncbi:endo-1,3(4)-beta-glucanase [Thraustotheca clavata]|uniref:glucan endo-1,3-beta-D-glucosidase n=1 Tax=Thraustotheca clavata TaxID=74557 RepID=A0A1V9YWQ0_9STRA|nr:endo-1,3(4)-beta-glucanase [Thraustotheca clavata]